MNNGPLISNVIIFLNTAKYLQDAIESVFAQTYDNWELLLVDDGSSDGSTDIALRYAEQYPEKVRYLAHPGHQNRGMGATRNLGVRHARGEYIALLDSDDVWMPHKLERQAEILRSHPEAGMVYGLSQYWYGWTGKPEDVRRDAVPKLGIQANELYDPPTLLSLLYPLGDARTPCPSDLLLRRETVEQVGGFVEDFKGIYHLYEDQAFLAKVNLKWPVFVANECWDKYRRHPEQCISVRREEGHYHTVRVVFFKWLEQYLHEQEVNDPKVWKLLREKQVESGNVRIGELERALAKQRRRTKRLKARNRALKAERRKFDRQLRDRGDLRGLPKRLGYLRARLLGR
jgi:glycosyltransferase involved in cell wall biosynthesis